MKKITKAVIAAAGYGTRFLPATKTVPKEMLPLIDKPIIQVLVEELVASGIKDIIIVTRRGQHVMEDHFDSNFELEYMLKENGKKERLEMTKEPSQLANFIFVRQSRDMPYGNGTPLLCVKDAIVKGEPFVYAFGDDLVKSKIPCARQLIDFYEKNPGAAAVLAVQEIPQSEVSHYGIVRIKKGTKNQLAEIVEKPALAKAPSRLASFGRYILDDQVIKLLAEKKLGQGGELWLVDALQRLAKKKKVLVVPIEGEWMTTGDPFRFIKAIIEYGLDRPDLAPALKAYLASLEP